MFSESTFPLSSAFVHHALLLDLAFKQHTRNHHIIVYRATRAINIAVRPDGTSAKLPEISLRRLGERVRFSPDGKSLIYMQGLLASQDFWLLDLATMKSRPLTRLQNLATMRTFDVTSDGKQIVFDRLRENSQVVMIDLPKE